MKRLVPLLMIAALAFTGCSSNDTKGEDVASLANDAPAAGDDSTGGDSAGSGSDAEAAAAFGKCMRENGMPDFPDPVMDEYGVRFTGDAQKYSQEPVFQTAMGTCDHFIAAIQQRINEQNPGMMQDSAQGLVDCLREKGYDVPDPQVSDDGGIRIDQPEGVSQDEFNTAMEYCQTHQATPDAGQGS